jgi:hypothetical protein
MLSLALVRSGDLTWVPRQQPSPECGTDVATLDPPGGPW